MEVQSVIKQPAESTQSVENYLYNELEKAHEAWLKERNDILDDLEHLKNIYKEVKPDGDIIERAYMFIKEGEI